MNISDTDKILLRKRAVIESVNDELKISAQFNIIIAIPSRDFLNNAVSALIAYQTFEKKSSIKNKS